MVFVGAQVELVLTEATRNLMPARELFIDFLLVLVGSASQLPPLHKTTCIKQHAIFFIQLDMIYPSW